MDAPETFVPLNAYYLLGTLSGKPLPVEPFSEYLPTITEVLTINKQETEQDASVYIEAYKRAVLESNFSKAIAAIEVLFIQREALARALIEATVLYIGRGDIRYVDLVLSLVYGNISAIATVLYTKILVNYPNKLREIRDAIAAAERELIAAEERRAKKRNVDAKESRSKIIAYAELVMDVHEGKITATDILESPEMANKTAVLRKNVAGYHYGLLNQVDPDCTVLLIQLSDLNEFKEKHFTDARKTPLVMPKSTTADRKIADRLEAPRR